MELTQRSEDLERQVEGLLKENLELKQALSLVTKEMRDELQAIKEKLRTN